MHVGNDDDTSRDAKFCVSTIGYIYAGLWRRDESRLYMRFTNVTLQSILVPYSLLYAGEKVSPCLMSPVVMPFFSQRARCSEVPWLKLSGTV